MKRIKIKLGKKRVFKIEKKIKVLSYRGVVYNYAWPLVEVD